MAARSFDPGRQRLDRRGEDAAAAYAVARGAKVIARNWRCRFGELDLVLEDAGEIAFAEVKTRSTAAFGGAREAVSAEKTRRIARAALAWLEANDAGERPCRFDVFAVTPSSGELAVEWIKDAFVAPTLED